MNSWVGRDMTHAEYRVMGWQRVFGDVICTTLVTNAMLSFLTHLVIKFSWIVLCNNFACCLFFYYFMQV